MGQLAPRLRTAVGHSDVLIMVKDGSTPQHTQTQGLCLLSPRYITYSICQNKSHGQAQLQHVGEIYTCHVMNGVKNEYFGNIIKYTILIKVTTCKIGSLRFGHIEL